jgi:hypothetical protein
MAVVGAAFLLAVSRAFARIHVEYDNPRRSSLVHLVDPVAGQIGKRGEVLGRLSHFVSKRPIWLAEAAKPIIARSPTTQRIPTGHVRGLKPTGRGTALGVVHVLIALR